MNKMIIFMSFVLSLALLHYGTSTKVQMDHLKEQVEGLEAGNLDMQRRIKGKESLAKREAVALPVEYSLVMNQVRILESDSGTRMSIQLETSKDADDITDHYVDTEYKGVRALRIKIVVDKISEETDMGAVLDDIHLLEEDTDFMSSEISKDNSLLIVKGEIYGI
jgi:hypothetical protein